VNPIDRKAENYKKISQLQQLSAENEPLLQNLTDTIDSKFGTHSTKPDFKEPKEIELKTTRQETKERKPWYEVEHVRDALRTTSIVDNLDVLPGIIREIKAGGEFKIINPDMDKLLNPTQRGWRMVALDLQASNGQIVEYQIVPREMKEAGKIGHAQYKEFRGMDKNLMTDEQALAKAEADRQQVLLYRGAWEAYLRRTGQTEEQILQIVEQARREL
ncbi:MAG TPA: hypothetical protein V6C72_00050, partial [Chroococcales cyanobacterium]